MVLLRVCVFILSVVLVSFGALFLFVEEDILKAAFPSAVFPSAANSNLNGLRIAKKPSPPRPFLNDPSWVALESPWPSDIVCQRETGHCQRQCLGGRPNEIRYHHYFPLGLIDRLTIIAWMVELAGYLCATAYVPTPQVFLSKAHNNETDLSPDLVWSDFVNFTFWDGTPAVKTLGQEEWKEGDYNWTTLITKGDRDFGRFNRSEIYATIEETFQRAAALSVKDDNTKFFWDIQLYYYAAHDPLCDSLKERDAYLGFPKRIACTEDQKRTYAKWTQPKVFEDTIEDLWGQLVAQYPGHLFGSWHIRRGDAIGECDTSLERLKQYVQRTFANVQEKVVVLLRTDETDPGYLQALKDIIKEHTSNVVLIFSDELVQSYLSKNLQEKFNNNYHLFQLVNGLGGMAHAFSWEHRRKFDCKDFFDLRQHLDSTQPKIPTGNESAVEGWNTDLYYTW